MNLPGKRWPGAPSGPSGAAVATALARSASRSPTIPMRNFMARACAGRQPPYMAPRGQAVIHSAQALPILRNARVQAPAMCTLGGTNFSTGSMSCQSGYEYRCNSTTWEPTGRMC